MTLDKRELLAMQEELLIRIALIEIAQEEAETLDARDSSVPNPRALRAMQRALRRRNILRFTKRTLPKAARAAAALALLFYLTLTTVLATSADARAKFLTLFINTTPYYSELSLNPIEPSYAAAPEGWKEKYYPDFIPEGWTLENLDAIFSTALYTKDENHRLRFSVYDENTNVSINTQGATIRHVSLNGIMAMVAENRDEGFTWVTWSMGDRMIVVYMDANADAALDVAVSVREVEGHKP